MSAEAGFILSAVRRFFDAQVRLDDPEGVDWKKLEELALRHRVAPMVSTTVLLSVPLPSAAISRIYDRRQDSTRISLLQTSELVALLDVFDEHGIRAVALKGPPLSDYLYWDPAVRSSLDLDLLVAWDEVLRIRDLLLSRGYKITSALHWNSDSACLASRENEISFVDSYGAVSVDLHWRLMPPYFANPFDGGESTPSMMFIELAGRKVRALAPEPLLLYLCSHGAKHAFNRLAWICDVAALLRKCPDLDWPAILEQAKRTHTSRQLWVGVQLAVDLLGAPPPPEMPRDPIVQALTRQVTDRLLSGTLALPSSRELSSFILQVLERPEQRLRYLLGSVMTPSEAEYDVVRLPPFLFFLYYPLRILRLIGRAVSLPFSRSIRES
jgi:hypothetical protein